MSSITTAPESQSQAGSSAAAAISAEMITSLRSTFESNPAHRIAQNAVTQTTVDDIALNRQVICNTPNTFSNHLDDWEVTDQQKSGRCWMFAGLNLFRAGAMQAMNTREFEFSQNYTLFWDKFERANYFLETIIETSTDPVDDRAVAFLLDRPLDDGGQWNMFVNIVKKHGLVPKEAMPESESSSNTRRMNTILLYKLREGARTLRDLRSNGAPMEAARAAKQDILQAVYRILSIHLGTPPESFDWQWKDKDKKFHREGRMTPLEFADKYVTIPLDEYVCIVHDPRQSSPFNATYTVQYLGNVCGGDSVKYLNVDMDMMKDLTRQSIEKGEPVWFGCDVGKMMRRDLGVWDRNLFDYAGVYDTSFGLSKSDRLVYHETLMTHAMLFTGVDVDGGRTRRWRVENSWGDKNGQKGYYTMNDSWFDEYVFEIAARRSDLPAELQQALDVEPTVLPPWDPMGALAR